MTRATWWVFGVGLGWLCAHALGLLGPLTELTYPLLSVGSVIAIIVGVRVNKPDAPGPWYVLTAGMPAPMAGGARLFGWRRSVILTFVASLLVIEAAGLCTTFGPHF